MFFHDFALKSTKICFNSEYFFISISERRKIFCLSIEDELNVLGLIRFPFPVLRYLEQSDMTRVIQRSFLKKKKKFFKNALTRKN